MTVAVAVFVVVVVFAAVWFRPRRRRDDLAPLESRDARDAVRESVERRR
jgi:hypothetical protein